MKMKPNSVVSPLPGMLVRFLFDTRVGLFVSDRAYLCGGKLYHLIVKVGHKPELTFVKVLVNPGAL